jgi:uncharacterized cupredoxin-like copper-binding protein
MVSAFTTRAARLAGRVIGAGFIAILAWRSDAAAADWSQAQVIPLVTSDYKFEPNRLEFVRDQPYRIHLENHGKELHEFNAAALFKAAEIGNPEVLNPDETEVALQPGEQKDLLLVPKQPGDYRLICPDHDWAGMTGTITVR